MIDVLALANFEAHGRKMRGDLMNAMSDHAIAKLVRAKAANADASLNQSEIMGVLDEITGKHPRSELYKYRDALDTLMMHSLRSDAGAPKGWVMVPESEWDNVYRGFDTKVTAPTESKPSTAT